MSSTTIGNKILVLYTSSQSSLNKKRETLAEEMKLKVCSVSEQGTMTFSVVGSWGFRD